MATITFSRRPGQRLLIAFAVLLAACLSITLVERSLFSHSLDRTLTDSKTAELANETNTLATRAADAALATGLSPSREFLHRRAALSAQLNDLQTAHDRLTSEPKWRESPAALEDFDVLLGVMARVAVAPNQAKAKHLLPGLVKRASTYAEDMSADSSRFSAALSLRNINQLWKYGATVPSFCGILILALSALLLLPALRRISTTNQTLISLEAGSAAQAAELERRNAELRAQQDELREQESEMIMKTQQLESTSNGSQQAAQRFEELFQGLPVACVGFSQDGLIFEWNRASTDLFGHDAYQILHQGLWQHISEPAFRSRGKSLVKQVFKGKAFKDTEWSYVRADGERRHVLGHLFPVRGLDGRILGGIASCLDVTDRKRAEDELRSSEKLFRDLIDSLHEGVLLYDQAGQIVVANRQAGVLIGAAQDSLIGRRVDQIKRRYVGADAEPIALDALPHRQCMKTGKPIEESLVGWLPSKGEGQDVRWFSVNAIPLYRVNEDQPHGVLTSFSEVTDRLLHEAQLKDRQDLLEQANTQLEALAVTDGLTGLFNHRAFQERLDEELRTGRDPLSLILVDVDLFKSYNDAFGHPEGDRVLRQVATIMRNLAGEEGVVARYGGEEFAFILPGYNAKAATKFGQELCRRVAQAPWPNRSITISAGIATVGGILVDPASLIRASDEALYASKHAGRNQATHAGTMSKPELRVA